MGVLFKPHSIGFHSKHFQNNILSNKTFRNDIHFKMIQKWYFNAFAYGVISAPSHVIAFTEILIAINIL